MERREVKQHEASPVAGGWSDSQVADFARRFVRANPPRVWEMLGRELQVGLIDSVVLDVVLSQDRAEDGGSVVISDIVKLRAGLESRLAETHGYDLVK